MKPEDPLKELPQSMRDELKQLLKSGITTWGELQALDELPSPKPSSSAASVFASMVEVSNNITSSAGIILWLHAGGDSMTRGRAYRFSNH